METGMARRVRDNPAFAELERRRTRFSWTLAVLMLAVYYIFLFLVAFAPGIMATPVAGAITLGFPLALGVIACAVLLTGIYIWRANTTFDRLTRAIVESRP